MEIYFKILHQYLSFVSWKLILHGFNNSVIVGSPFRVGVVDAAKVNVIGGWHSLVDTSNRMTLVAGHQKRMEFDVTDAGPGEKLGR